MKKYFVFVVLLLVATQQEVSAQFLKKLQKQVSNAVGGKSSNTGSSNLPADNVQPTHADLSKFNTKHFYTLQEGEKFSFYEACLLVQADQLSPQFLVVKDGKTFLIDNSGQHIATDAKKLVACSQQHIDRPEQMPFERLNGDKSKDYTKDTTLFSIQSPFAQAQMKTLDTAKLKEIDRNARSGNTALAVQQAMAYNAQAQKSMPSTGYKMYVLFKGKNYGMYDGFLSPVFNTDAKDFRIIAFNQTVNNANYAKTGQALLQESWLLSADGSKIKVPANGQILTTPDFSFLKILNLNMDPGSRSPTSQTLYDPKTAKSIQLPYGLEMVQSIDMKTGHVITTQLTGNNNKIYIDDKMVKSLTDEAGIKPANIFTSKDPGKWAIWGVNGLYFSNGVMVDGVISAKLQSQNDKFILSWIVLGSDNKTLELCSYEL